MVDDSYYNDLGGYSVCFLELHELGFEVFAAYTCCMDVYVVSKFI